MKYVPKRLVRTADVSRGRTSLRETLANFAIVLGSVVAAYAGLGVLADVVADRIPESWETRLAFLATRIDPEPDHEAAARLQAIFDRLLAADPELRALDYRLLVTRQEAPNAFALPGGLVAVTTGLLDTVEGDEGLALVLGHELGHHHRRHVLHRLGRALFVALPVTALAGDSGRWLGTLLGLLEGKYSRDQEREADRIGLALVFKSYRTTDGALEFFEKMLAESGPSGRWARMTTEHPALEERIRDLRRLAEELSRNDA
jgi:predicted Zn-dependent protease